MAVSNWAVLGLAALAVPLPAAGSSVATRPAPRDVKIQRLTWAKDVDGPAPIRAIHVRNDFGDIRARRAPDRRLDLLAVVQRLDPGPDGVGFTVERRGDVVALTVAYPPGRVRDADPDPPKDSYDRLDLTVFVPTGVSFDGQTLRGMVEVRGLESDVEAVTREGDIFVATTGTVQARSGSGEITGILERSQGTRPLLFETVSGPIRLTLAREPALEMRIDTGGAIESDFTLARRPAGGRLRARGGDPRAARTLLVHSERGAVEVRRGDR